MSLDEDRARHRRADADPSRDLDIWPRDHVEVVDPGGLPGGEHRSNCRRRHRPNPVSDRHHVRFLAMRRDERRHLVRVEAMDDRRINVEDQGHLLGHGGEDLPG